MIKVKTKKDLFKTILNDNYELTLERSIKNNKKFEYYLNNGKDLIVVSKKIANNLIEKYDVNLIDLTDFKYYYLETNYGTLSIRATSKIEAIDLFYENYNDGKILYIGE